MKVDLAVIGLGYVGLPLAHTATAAGLSVIGFDVSKHVVDGLNAGRSHVDDLTDDDVAGMVGQGFRATTEVADLGQAETLVICVPTPLAEAGGPDMTYVESAVDAVAQVLQSGMTVILESTTYPGTTEELVRPKLEAGGLLAGKDFHLAFSPERIDPGNETFGPKNTPKVVGGCTPACTEKAASFYERFVDQAVRVKGTREAETAKLLENTYRHINIALVNEMARFCHDLGIDLWDVIDAAKTKPFGFQAFYPGPGVGGHCIPIDPNYLSYSVKARLGYPFRFVELAQEINETMPNYVAGRIQNILNEDAKSVNGARILLLGVTYKANIADQRESPAVPLATRLMALGADVRFHDPHVTTWDAVPGAQPVDNLVQAVRDADLTVLMQKHREYDAETLVSEAKRLFDTRGLTAGMENAHRL